MKVSKEVRIGISSLVILAIAYWGINFLKGQNLFSGTNIYYATYQNVEGLEMSSPVYIKGLKVGTVLNVSLSDVSDNLKVTISVKSKYKLASNSVAVLGSPSMLSGKAIIINPGDSKEILKDGGTMLTSVNDGMMSKVNDISDKAVNLIDTLTITLGRINTLLDQSMINNVQNTVSNIKDMSYNANEFISTEKSKIAALTSNLNDLSIELKRTMPDVKGTMGNLRELSDSLKMSLPEMINEIDNIITSINSKNGTIGKLINCDSLYNNLNLTLEDAAALLEDLKANPKRYVQFSLFGRKDKTKKE